MFLRDFDAQKSFEVCEMKNKMMILYSIRVKYMFKRIVC